jgi:hypothetical protein
MHVLGILATAATAVLTIGAGAAHAAPVALCMKAGQPVVAPAADGTCASGYTKTETASQADLTAARNRISALEAKLASVTATADTLRISGVNVRIDNGAGSTATSNGRGNLILGYNESPGRQTGSHNFLLGRSHTATGYGGIVAGASNKLVGGYAVAVGYGNTAQGKYSFAAGDRNTARGERSSATGGSQNTASGLAASVTGGMLNAARARWSAVAGGCGNHADGVIQTTPEPLDCIRPETAYEGGEFGFVGGGRLGLARGVGSAVTGGEDGRALGAGSSVAGGFGNAAEGPASAVPGGRYNRALGLGSAVTGGRANRAEAEDSTVTGGSDNVAAAHYAAILGGSRRTVTTVHGTYPAGS